MLCCEVKRVLYFFLDGTMGEQRARDLQQHLGLCPDCHQRIVLQRRLRLFVQHRLKPVPATERFKLRLSRSLRGVAVD